MEAARGPATTGDGEMYKYRLWLNMISNRQRADVERVEACWQAVC